MNAALVKPNHMRETPLKLISTHQPLLVGNSDVVSYDRKVFNITTDMLAVKI